MLIRATARTSLALFGAAFTASSLRSLWRTPATGWLLRQRRYLGLSFAFSHALHALAILGLALVLGDAFEINLVTVIFGGGAYVMIALMAATSSDRAVRLARPAPLAPAALGRRLLDLDRLRELLHRARGDGDRARERIARLRAGRRLHLGPARPADRGLVARAASAGSTRSRVPCLTRRPGCSRSRWRV